MIAKRTPLALAFIALTTLACLPAPAWAQRRGGGHHGGGHRSGGHAVPRGGSPGHSPRGVAQARHPRAGTGTGGYYGHYYGGHYRPYHHGYYGYYRPYGYASFYFGWPYYYSGWWPYTAGGYYGPSYYAPSYGYGYDARMAPPAGEGELYDESEPPEGSDPSYGTPPRSDRNTGRVRLEVKPDDASIYVDDEFWGNARETKFLTLRSGRHAIELVRPGFATVRREVEVVRGETSDLLVELDRP